MVLIFLQHGKTTFNIPSILKNSGLTNEGKLEVVKVSEILKKYKFDYVFTSELKSTKETCEIIKKELNQDFSIISSNKLNERNYGYLSGHNNRELENIYSKENVYKWTKTYYGLPPNGESLHDVKNRCGDYFDENILSLSDKNILFISHNDVLKSLFVHLELEDKFNIENFVLSSEPIIIDIKNKRFNKVY